MAAIELKGLDALNDAIKEALNKYPDEAERVLRGVATEFRKKVKTDTPSSKRNNKNKKLINRYHVTQVKGYGKNLSVDFYSNAPHFHLIERGHRIVRKDGTDTGRKTTGRYMVKINAEKFESGHFKKEVEKMATKVLKGLI